MRNLLKVLHNRQIARQEFKAEKELVNLNFNNELAIRMEYKRQLLFNQIMEQTNSNPLSAIDIVNVNNTIEINKQKGYIDEFYNIVK